MDIQKSGYVAEVEQTDVPQINGLLVQHRSGYHPPGNEIPRSPNLLPLLHGWNGEWSRGVVWLQLLISCDDHGRSAEKREHEGRTFEKPERVLTLTVDPALDRAQVGVREECVSVSVRILDSDQITGSRIDVSRPPTLTDSSTFNSSPSENWNSTSRVGHLITCERLER